MKKYLKNLLVTSIDFPNADHCLLKLTNESGPLPEIHPGQFVEIKIENAADTFLRRPISVNYVEDTKNELWLLVHAVGNGTRKLMTLKSGEHLDCLFPLGNGFDIFPKTVAGTMAKNMVLIGGGVGTAPLLYYGKRLKEAGIAPTFLLGGKKQDDILQLDEFRKWGEVFVTTEDGSMGTKGFVTNHEILQTSFDGIASCGPKPMMKAIADYARRQNIPCQVSLENLMACGLGACLCCVEKTKSGHLCVCTDGPVFYSDQLLW